MSGVFFSVGNFAVNGFFILQNVMTGGYMNNNNNNKESSSIMLETMEEIAVGRVAFTSRSHYQIIVDEHACFATLSGEFLFRIQNAADYPTVGDHVTFTYHDGKKKAMIHEVLPRKSQISRKARGSLQQEQLIAANVDYALVCMSLNEDFNLMRLERYLYALTGSHVAPVIVLTKTDLVDQSSLNQYVSSSSKRFPKIPVVCVSNKEPQTLHQLEPYFEVGKTAVMLGASGVGKSSLVNGLFCDEIMQTSEINESSGRGRHTTTHRELIVLPSGGVVIDTPGMRVFGLWNMSETSELFSDIDAIVAQCKYSDCSHTVEQGCAVQMSLQEGVLSLPRYQSYLKLSREQQFHRAKTDRSVREKRRMRMKKRESMKEQRRRR